ncbi:MAG: nucleotidyltransferase family protein [Chitinophagaceae bacterium]|nr:nucleotidyltransferase family protein [Chitinophagaceae bacterium]
MLSKIDIETKLLELKPVIVEKFHVSKLGYFGSYVSGEQSKESDLDLLVEFSKPVGWSFFTLEKFLEEALGLQVDPVRKASLKNRIRVSILKQVIYI